MAHLDPVICYQSNSQHRYELMTAFQLYRVVQLYRVSNCTEYRAAEIQTYQQQQQKTTQLKQINQKQKHQHTPV